MSSLLFNKALDKKIKRRTRIIVGVVAFAIILFLGTTDVSTLLDFSLALDATSSGGQASQKGVDASTGIFRGKGFEKKGTNIGMDDPPPIIIDPPTGNIIDEGSNTVIITGNEVISNSEGGGALGSTVGLQGFQELVTEDVQIFPSIRTPAKGQTVSVTMLIEWLGENPATVTHAQFGQFDDFISYSFSQQLPQRVFDDSSSDEKRSGEFVFQLTIPEDFPENNFVIPVRLLIDTGEFAHTVTSELEITEPQGIIKGFSFAEAIRSFLALLRVGN